MTELASSKTPLYLRSREKLKNKRKAMNLTQQQVADFLNVKRNTYTEIETGVRDIPFSTALKLKFFLKFKSDEVLLRNAETMEMVAQEKIPSP